MRQLYIIRHGLAGTCLEDQTLDDERSLTKKGKEKMKEISKALKDLNISFDMVFTSPLLRSLESAEIANTHCGVSKEVTITNLLLPDALFNNLIKFLNTFKESETVAIVGHEPFLSSFASYCLTKNKTSFIDLKKGGVAVLEIDGSIKPGRCLLSCLMEPKHLIRAKSHK